MESKQGYMDVHSTLLAFDVVTRWHSVYRLDSDRMPFSDLGSERQPVQHSAQLVLAYVEHAESVHLLGNTSRLPWQDKACSALYLAQFELENISLRLVR